MNLRDLKSLLSGDALDFGCVTLKTRLGATLVKKLESSPNGYHKIRNIVKSLLQIGANLSQTREYRDLFEDILTKVSGMYMKCVHLVEYHWRELCALRRSSLSSSLQCLIFDFHSQVAEPLEEASLSIVEMNTFVTNCYFIVCDIGNEQNTRHASISSMASTAVNRATTDGSASSSNIYSMRNDSSISTAIQTNKFATRAELIKKDWLRFITFCRLCLLQLVDRKHN